MVQERNRKAESTNATFSLFNDNDPPSKRAIVTAALKLFVRRGYEVTSIREIAAEAGYTNPALFKFFRTKEELGKYLFERAYWMLLDKFGKHFDESGPLAPVLEGWVDSFLEIVSESLDAFLFVHDHLTVFWPEMAGRVGKKNLFRLMHRWLLAGRNAGSIAASTPIEIQSAALSGFFHQFARMIYLREIDPKKLSALRPGVLETLTRILNPGSSRSL